MTTISPATASTLVSRNPASGEIIGEVPITAAEAIPRVVGIARAAQPPWRALGTKQRADVLRPAGEALVEEAERMGTLLTREMGKPLAEAIGEVRSCGTSLARTLDDITAALEPELIEDDALRSWIHFDPFGVCAAITPWNFPVSMPHWLVLPALAAGNTVVLKPSEETPLVAQAYADVLNRVLPDDVLQVIHGADTQGKALVGAAVDLIAFTGSRGAGAHILSAAGAGLKRVILELGGKDPMIVLDDADIEVAAQFAARNSFRNAGQVCVSTERIYVDERVADAFEQATARHALALRVGNGAEEGTDVGPMISDRQRDHVLRQIDDAVTRGASVAAGGADHPPHFVLPTVLTGVTADMDIMTEETFGPVACIARVRDADEAVERANDTPFGLGATVFGRDETRALEIARRLDAGMVGVNKSCGGASGTPWVGAKQSGYGYHGSWAGHRQFTQTRVVSMCAG